MSAVLLPIRLPDPCSRPRIVFPLDRQWTVCTTSCTRVASTSAANKLALPKCHPCAAGGTRWRSILISEAAPVLCAQL